MGLEDSYCVQLHVGVERWQTRRASLACPPPLLPSFHEHREREKEKTCFGVGVRVCASLDFGCLSGADLEKGMEWAKFSLAQQKIAFRTKGLLLLLPRLGLFWKRVSSIGVETDSSMLGLSVSVFRVLAYVYLDCSMKKSFLRRCLREKADSFASSCPFAGFALLWRGERDSTEKEVLPCHSPKKKKKKKERDVSGRSSF